jgi:hypothetical protein
MTLKKILPVLLFLTVISCKTNNTKDNTNDLDSIDLSEKEKVLNALDTNGNGIPIFYNMYLSVELSSLFESAGAVFSKELLNPYTKASDYITSYKKAMNLGVYAVDLSYSRAFEEYDIASKYFSAMGSLSAELGIPQEYFENTAKRFQENINSKDSLISIANEVYYETENYLKENERYATASVIIMGGWIEAIYIGTNVAIESKNVDIIERLVDQKYSLNNLLIMLKDYKDNEIIGEYYTKLSELRKTYDNLTIDIPADYNSSAPDSEAKLKNWIRDIRYLQSEVIKVRKSIIAQ